MRDRPGVDANRSWTYETIVNALPGVRVADWVAYCLQLGGFASVAIVLWVWYGLPQTTLVTAFVTIGVATLGSIELIYLSRRVRQADGSQRYWDLMFNSQIELVMGLVAFFIFVVYVFVVDARAGGGLLESLLGERPPVLVVFFMLVLVWDLCYRIGTAWWATVCSLWRALAEQPDVETRRQYWLLDGSIVLFSMSQLLVVFVVQGDWFLQGVVVGHVVAVGLVIGVATLIEEHKL